MRILILIFLLNFISCGKDFQDTFTKVESSPYAGQGIDPRLDEYIDTYYAFSGQVPDYPIQIAEIGKLGVCITYGDGTKAILISSDMIEEEYSLTLEYIILHEIGHCSHGRPHVTEYLSTDNGSRYKSMMHPYVMSESNYERDRSYYISELVNPNLDVNDFFTLTE